MTLLFRNVLMVLLVVVMRLSWSNQGKIKVEGYRLRVKSRRAEIDDLIEDKIGIVGKGEK